MSLIVVHVNDPAGCDLYVGRAVRRAKNPLAHVDSVFRNGYKIGQQVVGHPRLGDVDELTRYQTVEAFDWWVRESIAPRARRILEQLAEIPDEARLGCWCAGPARGAPAELTATDPIPRVCHGQVLAQLWEERT